MGRTPTLGEAISSLKNQGARAEAVVGLLTKQSPLQELDIDGLAGDSLKAGIGVLFQQGDFERGFAMARKGGVLEEIISLVQKAPVELKMPYYIMSKEDRQYKGIPLEVRTLPGFSYDTEKFDSYRDEQKTKVLNWVRDLKKSLVAEVLIPEQRYREAVQQMQQLGDMEDEILDISITHLGRVQMAKNVVQIGRGFERAIERAEDEGAYLLARVLKRKHIQSLLQLRVRKSVWGRGKTESRLIHDAITRAGDYFGETEAQATLEKGVALAVSDFEEEITRWMHDTINARDSYYRSTYRISGEERTRIYDEKERLENQRKRFAFEPSDTAKTAMSLISLVSEDKRAGLIKRLYDACIPPRGSFPNKSSVHDAFGIARALKDREKIFEYGVFLLPRDNCTSRYSFVQGITPGDEAKAVLRELAETPDERFRYVYNISPEEAVEEAPGLGMGKLLLSSWIERAIRTEDLRRIDKDVILDHPNYLFIARLAEKIGMRNVAREFYAEAEQFEKAAEQTDDSLEKAGFLIQQARKRVDRRFILGDDEGHSSKQGFYCGHKMDEEIELIEKAVKLARGQKGNRFFYQNQMSELAKELMQRAEYQEAVLLMRNARLPANVCKTIVGDSILEQAEAVQDFGGCYWLARAVGDEEQASKYKVLADAMGKRVYTELRDYKYQEPKPKRTPKRLSERTTRRLVADCSDDEIPF